MNRSRASAGQPPGLAIPGGSRDVPEIVAAIDRDDPCPRLDVVDCNVRWLLLHLIEETARYAGHPDLIRETLDGGRGM
jgi:hypothetical protein